MNRAQRRVRIYDLARVEPDRARELVDRISKSNVERRELEALVRAIASCREGRAGVEAAS